MPLPIWLIPIALKGAAVVAGTTGVGVAAHGAKKMKDANDTAKAAQSRHERNMARFEKENETTTKNMDKLGKLELEILHSFSEFSDLFEQTVSHFQSMMGRKSRKYLLAQAFSLEDLAVQA